MKISFLLIILIKNTLNEDVEYNTNKKTKSVRRYNADRFLQDLDKEEWLVAHIKDIEMDGRRDCRGETFKDRARRYKDMLRRDGGVVEYVSSEPLPFNKTDLITDTCKLEIEDTENYSKTSNEKLSSFTKIEGNKMLAITKDSMNTSELSDKRSKDKQNTTFAFESNGTSPIRDFKATTPTIKFKEVEENKEKNETDEKSRRASEYMFSSIEYYEEVPAFDASLCPEGTVEEIELEIDQLRSYDVECEQMIEWRSLDNGL